MAKARVYDSASGQWIYLDAKNADTVGGKLPSEFAPATHNHDSSYYTKTQSDTNYAPASHNHDSRYYTETELNSSGGGGQVHWNNLTNKPPTYPPDAHNHDNSYYTKTQSDTNYLAKADNLYSLTDKAAARTNLGLGTMATQASGSYAPVTHTHDDRYYTETETDSLLAGKSDNTHTHDSRYYTENEVDSLLNNKANSIHNHDGVYVKGNMKMTVSTTAPTTPTTNDIWINI